MSPQQVRLLQEQMSRQRVASRDAHSSRTFQRLISLLDRAGPERLASAVAESLIAQRLVRSGFSVESDVPTPSGKSCDFRATRRDRILCVHVKRLRSETGEGPAIPRRLRAAIHCGRRVRAELWWSPRLGPRDLPRLGRSFDAFLREAAIGESLSVRDAPDIEIGRIRIHRPAQRRLELLCERADRARTLDRIERLVLRAFDQCMPRSANVIALVGDHQGDCELLDVALRGPIVERWDQFPIRGERRAYGRADDGLWSRHRAPWCRFAVSLTLRSNRSGIRLSRGALLTRGDDAAAETSVDLVRRGLLRSR